MSHAGAEQGAPDTGLACLVLLLGFHQIAADAEQFRHDLGKSEPADADDLVRLGKRAGARAKRARLKLEQIEAAPAPFIARGADGSFFLIGGVRDDKVLVQRPGEPPSLIDSDALASNWSGEIVLATTRAGLGLGAGKFDVSWFVPALWRYRHLLRDVLLASLVLQIFALATPLFFQVVIDKVLVHRGLTTLDVLAWGLGAVIVFETALGGLRAWLFTHTTSRVDVELGAKLYRHVLSLPLAYFESRRVGDTVARVRELDTVREFLTSSAATARPMSVRQSARPQSPFSRALTYSLLAGAGVGVLGNDMARAEREPGNDEQEIERLRAEMGLYGRALTERPEEALRRNSATRQAQRLLAIPADGQVGDQTRREIRARRAGAEQQLNQFYSRRESAEDAQRLRDAQPSEFSPVLRQLPNVSAYAGIGVGLLARRGITGLVNRALTRSNDAADAIFRPAARYGALPKSIPEFERRANDLNAFWRAGGRSEPFVTAPGRAAGLRPAAARTAGEPSDLFPAPRGPIPARIGNTPIPGGGGPSQFRFPDYAMQASGAAEVGVTQIGLNNAHRELEEAERELALDDRNLVKMRAVENARDTVAAWDAAQRFGYGVMAGGPIGAKMGYHHTRPRDVGIGARERMVLNRYLRSLSPRRT